MFDDVDISTFTDTYVVPWAINVALAIAIFVVGRVLIRVLLGVLVKFFNRAGLDEILVNFIASITRAILLLVIVIASLNQLGVDTT